MYIKTNDIVQYFKTGSLVVELRDQDRDENYHCNQNGQKNGPYDGAYDTLELASATLQDNRLGAQVRRA